MTGKIHKHLELWSGKSLIYGFSPFNFPVIIVLWLILSYFLFPIVCSFTTEPYLVTLRYHVKTVGAYTLKFHHYIFQDPSTNFYPFENSLTNLKITNTGNQPISCWISNYNLTAREVLTKHYLPTLDQYNPQDRPGQLLDNEGNLGARNQPYRTFFLKESEQIILSFHGLKRTIECPREGSQISVRIDDSVEVNHRFTKEVSGLDVITTGQNKEKMAALFIPSYAFGKFHIAGPEGFDLIQGTLTQMGSSEQIPLGPVPFPRLGFIITLAVSLIFSCVVYVLLRQFLSLFKLAYLDQTWIDTPVFSDKDMSFLVVSGLIVITFTGSVPPIHMLDSVHYIETASRLGELFTTHTYPAYRNPGYMIFIWLVRKLMGPGYGLILIQQFVFFLTAFLMYKTVEYFTQGNRFAAWITGLLYVLNPLNLVFSQFIQPEGFWRDLIVLWFFSLVLIMEQKKWATLLGGFALGVLMLSRSSALPSVILFVSVGSLVAWKRIPLFKYILTTFMVIALIYFPYYFYLRFTGTRSQAYPSAVHHSFSFLFLDNTLDTYSPCFIGFEEDFANRKTDNLPLILPWMKASLSSPLNSTDPKADEVTPKAILFEKCVYQSNYLRFPKQQLGILAKRILNSLWKSDLKDIDVWDYGKIYTRKFITEERTSPYGNKHFNPYYYSEKWNVQDYSSAWKFIFKFLYRTWPYVELAVLSFCVISLLIAHLYPYTSQPSIFRRLILLTTSFSLLYLADGVMYSVFGIVFSRRMMIPIAPSMLLVFGITIGVVSKTLNLRK